MESKLTLPILCAYLPHKATIYDAFSNIEWELENGEHLDYLLINQQIKDREFHHKLLLKPLSDLTDEQIAELDLLHDFSVMIFSQIKRQPLRYPYVITQKLLEWHFDVFGGIEAGWALPLTAKQD